MNDYYEEPRKRFDAGQADTFVKIWRFVLTTDLDGTSAEAKRLDWNGVDDELVEDSKTFTVWAPSGKYVGIAGVTGRAIYMHDARRWEVLELLSYGRIKGQLVGAMDTTDGTWTIDQIEVLFGADPRDDPSDADEEVTVYNTDHTMEGDDNGIARAEWNPVQKRWELYQLTCKSEE